jgi:hypothetical protein
VTASPTIRLNKTAKISFQERNASHKMTSTPKIAKDVSRNALCRITENWSSFMGTWPVISTFAPYLSPSFKSTAARRMASVAGRPGCNAVKSRGGCTSMKRLSRSTWIGRPATSSCQEKNGRSTGQHVVQRPLRQRQWPRQPFELDLACLDALGRKG